ncbi:MAG: ubiquinol-cytochrome c reductase iron-sulfur subunit [Gaiellaceae bacterium]
MSRVKDVLISGAVLALGRGSRRRQRRAERRIVAPGAPDRRAETLVLVLFGLVTVAAVVFIAVYAIDRIGHQTQWLGLALGLAFALLSGACIVIARRLVVSEELTEEYPTVQHPEEQQAIDEIVDESGSRFTRGGLVKLAGAGALGALGVAALTPAASLGPVADISQLARTPWRRGRRLVDESGKPLAARDVERESFYTAYPEGADRELIGSPVVVVRIQSGVVAYSKICTHAGCAIALYRKPTFAPTQPRPALVCPCHYSTFDPAQDGKVLFGPAGRPLPRLPLLVDGDGNLRAAGNFTSPPGPSWAGVRQHEAHS